MSVHRPVPAATVHPFDPPTARDQSRAGPGDGTDRTVRKNDRLLLTVKDAADRLGIGRSLMYELIGEGQIASIRVGRLRRVPLESLTDYVASMGRQAGRPGPPRDPFRPSQASPGERRSTGRIVTSSFI